MIFYLKWKLNPNSENVFEFIDIRKNKEDGIVYDRTNGKHLLPLVYIDPNKNYDNIIFHTIINITKPKRNILIFFIKDSVKDGTRVIDINLGSSILTINNRIKEFFYWNIFNNIPDQPNNNQRYKLSKNALYNFIDDMDANLIGPICGKQYHIKLTYINNVFEDVD